MSDTGSSPGVAGGGERQFAVWFSDPSRKWILRDKPTPPWRLIKLGEILISDTKIVLRGRHHVLLWWSEAAEYALDRSRCANVLVNGRTVSFEVTLEPDERKRLTVWVEDAAGAAALAAALPAQQTPEFQKTQAEVTAFQRSLAAVGGRSVVTPVLVGLNVVVFVLTALGGGGVFEPDGERLIHWGTNYGPLTSSGEAWRLFTSTFLHFGIVHLLLNMWALFSLGTLTERLYGSMQYVVLYLFAGLGGSLASLYWNPGVNSAGASGAIFGVIGALLAFMVNPATRIAPSVATPQRNSALFFIAYNLMNGFSHRGIDNAAHIGGLVCGFAIGWFLARPLSVDARRQLGPRLGAVSAAATVVLIMAAWPILRPSPLRQAENAFRAQFRAFAAAEHPAVAARNSLAQRHTLNKLTDVAWGEEIRSEVIPLWQQARAALEGPALPAESKLAPAQAALREYVDANLKALALTATAEVSGNVAYAAEAEKSEQAFNVMRVRVKQAVRVLN